MARTGGTDGKREGKRLNMGGSDPWKVYEGGEEERGEEMPPHPEQEAAHPHENPQPEAKVPARRGRSSKIAAKSPQDIAKPDNGQAEILPRREGESVISAPRFCILTVPLRNIPGHPLVVHAFSAKARQIMREAQEAGSVGRKKKPREPKDFKEAYMGARHISREGWDGVTCATFRNSMISACRLVGFKMTVGKLSVFIEADGNSREDGTPLVRIFGEPVPFEAPVRNASGVADIRVRPRWDEWTANLRVRFDREQFSDMDVINLLVRAGAQCGIGEGRPDSSNSFGQGWGLFEIDLAKGVEMFDVPAPQINFTRRVPRIEGRREG